MSKTRTISLPVPPSPLSIAADIIERGQPIPPIERIRFFSDTQWEEFILEWADSLKDEYDRVERCGGAGDMGRDIIAYKKDDSGGWDNFQCKHYKAPLQPSDVWTEFGKLIYYTYKKDYSCPENYYFVAPQGAGTKLSNLLKNHSLLKSELLKNWDKYCMKNITSTSIIKLNDELKAYVESIDFAIFKTIPPLRIIDQHAKTRWHTARFGGGLPHRPPSEIPPDLPTEQEAQYLRQLLDAYGDYLKRPVECPDDISLEKQILEHFYDSRREFYSAESLRTFSRDTLPPGQFENLQDEIHCGIADEVRTDHMDGYKRVLAAVKTARSLQITAHALVSRLTMRDRGGICHQLANDDKVRWVQ